MNIAMTEEIIKEIISERKRQHEKWGEQNLHPLEWLAILTEETGEVSKEVVEMNMAKNESDKQEKLIKYKKELIQVAEVAIQAIEDLERNGHIINNNQN